MNAFTHTTSIYEGLDLVHRNGGQAKFLETALHQNVDGYLETLAARILEGGGAEAMSEVVEKLDNDSAALTPKESTVLARSGHPTVTDNGATVYDRAPEVPRLTQAELEEIQDRQVTIHKGRRR